MNRIKYFLSLMLACQGMLFSGLFAQNEVPNYSFESWDALNPDFWNTFNSSIDTNVTPSPDAYDGSVSARLEVNNPNSLPPMLQAHNGASYPFPVSQNYNYLAGYYKYFPQGGDTVYIHVTLHGEGEDLPLREGDLKIYSMTPEWTRFEVPIIEYNGGPVTQGVIFFHLTAIPAPHAGSLFLLDNLSLEMEPTSIDGEGPALADDFVLGQNYPNPFNPTTDFGFWIPDFGLVDIKIFDIQGRLIRTIIHENMAPGVHETTWNGKNGAGGPAASGVYIYQLSIDGKFAAAKKMILVR